MTKKVIIIFSIIIVLGIISIILAFIGISNFFKEEKSMIEEV